MLECMMIGIFLYCGNGAQPSAMFPQSNNLPTATMAAQMVRARQRPTVAAQPTLDMNQVMHDMARANEQFQCNIRNKQWPC